MSALTSEWWFVSRSPLGQSQIKVTLLGERPENLWGVRLTSIDDVVDVLGNHHSRGMLFNAVDGSMLSFWGLGPANKTYGGTLVQGWTARCSGAGSRRRACGALADHVESDGRAPQVCRLCAPQRRPVL